ncbi:MAG: GNAT family N-acetyltransferase [Alphaproteobacteria bacterium]|nr:GNAT family N-acetyltransferase [Alphaproteobacteria bacterium]
MTQISIRQFGPDEAAAWRTIRLEALANEPVAFGQSLADGEKQTIEDYRKTVSGPFPPFAAFEGAAPIGTAGFYVMDGAKRAHRGMLWGMYVSPSHRGRGIGRKLIGAVIEHARGRVEQIHLHAVTTNTAACELYRGMGFVAYGVEPRALRYAGRDYDETLMVLMIHPPAQ